MREGRVVEEITARALAAGEARHPYTQELLRASRGYRKADA
jgi:ABC-type dipeptide/oligopeptide/nickel transport system ATPase component